MPVIAPLTAASMSASAKTMFGDLPPSSSESRLSVPAASRMIVLPTSVEPVNAILSTRGSRTSAMPARPPGPVTAVLGAEVAELPDGPAALGGGHPRPGAALERSARGRHGEVDVALVPLGHRGAGLLGRGVDRLVGLAGDRGAPGACDEELSCGHRDLLRRPAGQRHGWFANSCLISEIDWSASRSRTRTTSRARSSRRASAASVTTATAGFSDMTRPRAALVFTPTTGRLR